MPDTNNPAPAPATASPKKSPAARGEVKQEHLTEFTLAEQLVLSAQKEVYSSPFAEGGIDAAFLTALLADIVGARQEASTAAVQTTDRKVATASETDTQRLLVSLLRGVQARARQQFADTEPARLKDYHIGDKQALDANRPHLEQCAADILAKAAVDALPGTNAAKQAALAQALTDYKNAQAVQTTAQTGATNARTTLDEQVAAIAARRRKIQFAADATWPHENAANAAIRREFKLPPNKALKA